MHFHSQERSKMATYCSSIPECCVTEVKVSLTGSPLFRRRVREISVRYGVTPETITFFSYPHMPALNLCDAGYSGSSQTRPISR